MEYISDEKSTRSMYSEESTCGSIMMKFAAVTLAVLALFSPMEALTVPRTGNGALADEVQDFVDIIPFDKILDIVMEYISEDYEVQTFVQYLFSSEFKNLVSDVEALPEFWEVINYIQNAGLDAYEIVNAVNELLGLKKVTPPVQILKITGGVRGLIDDVKALLPLEKIEAMFEEKMAKSPVFKGVVEKLSSPASQKVVNEVCGNANFQKLLVMAKEAGVDIALVKKLLELILGLQVPCSV